MKLKTLLTLFITFFILINCSGDDSSFTNNSVINNSNNSSSGTIISDSKKNYPTSILKTGQTKSYDINGEEVTDGSIKDDGYYQAGAVREYIKNKDVVDDTITGITWEESNHSGEIVLTLREASKYCSDLSLNNSNNWQLPTAKELLGLVDYSKRDPAIDSEFSNINSSSNSIGYWSSSSTSGGFEFWVSFSTGNDHFYITQSNKHYVKCADLSYSNYKEADFSRDSVGIVIDNNSKLWWQDDKVVDAKNWQEAIDYCEASTLGGYSDWRLPNINELLSIVDYSASGAKLDKVFKNRVYGSYWSSTSHSASSKVAWGINFKYGTNSYYSKSKDNAIRCVRGGELISKIR